MKDVSLSLDVSAGRAALASQIDLKQNDQDDEQQCASD
jgi:hypothetical protein